MAKITFIDSVSPIENEAGAEVVAEAATREAAADATALDLPDTDDDNRKTLDTRESSKFQFE